MSSRAFTCRNAILAPMRQALPPRNRFPLIGNRPRILRSFRSETTEHIVTVHVRKNSACKCIFPETWKRCFSNISVAKGLPENTEIKSTKCYFDTSEKHTFPGIHVTLFERRTLYIKTSVKRPLSKRPNIGFQDQLSLNAGQKYCRIRNTFDLHLATICL